MRVLTHKQFKTEVENGRKLILANSIVYDVEKILLTHPGGIESLNNHIGKECSEDYNFHTKNGKKSWNKLKVGRLERKGLYKFFFGK